MSADAVDATGDELLAAAPVVLWRPGCGFCRLLFSNLDRHEVAYEVRNIWEDDEARALLNERIGCETVPSVLIGDDLLVNPSITEVLGRLDG